MIKPFLLIGSIAFATASCGPSGGGRAPSRAESDTPTATSRIPPRDADSFWRDVGFRGTIPDSIIGILQMVQDMYGRDRAIIDCLQELEKGAPVPVYALGSEDERHLIKMVCSSFAVKRIEGIKHRKGESCELVMIDVATPSGNVSVFLFREKQNDWREFYKMAYEH